MAFLSSKHKSNPTSTALYLKNHQKRVTQAIERNSQIDCTHVGVDEGNHERDVESESNYLLLQRRLINHFKHQYRFGLVCWL